MKLSRTSELCSLLSKAHKHHLTNFYVSTGGAVQQCNIFEPKHYSNLIRQKNPTYHLIHYLS